MLRQPWESASASVDNGDICGDECWWGRSPSVGQRQGACFEPDHSEIFMGCSPALLVSHQLEIWDEVVRNEQEWCSLPLGSGRILHCNSTL